MSLACDWNKAQRHLIKSDPVMKAIIKTVGPCTVKPRRDYFVVLCNAIFSQQISTAVARVLFNRFRNQFPQRRPTPARTIELFSGDPEKIMTFGLSRQKRTYVLDLANHFHSGALNTRKFRSMNDEQIVQSLIAVKGIGRWTAEMFLIFTLNRPDVFPVDDLGLKKGIQRAYGLKEMPTIAQMNKFAEPWRPFRSLATWYFWRWPAPVVVKPAARPLRVPR